MGETAHYNENDFIECFHQFKEGGAGFIEKHEMAIFVKKVAGIDTSAEEAEMKAEEEATKKATESEKPMSAEPITPKIR